MSRHKKRPVPAVTGHEPRIKLYNHIISVISK